MKGQNYKGKITRAKLQGQNYKGKITRAKITVFSLEK